MDFSPSFPAKGDFLCNHITLSLLFLFDIPFRADTVVMFSIRSYILHYTRMHYFSILIISLISCDASLHNESTQSMLSLSTHCYCLLIRWFFCTVFLVISKVFLKGDFPSDSSFLFLKFRVFCNDGKGIDLTHFLDMFIS